MAAFKSITRPERSTELTAADQHDLPTGARSLTRRELTRRKFTGGVMRIGILAAAVSGAVVGFSPEAAQAAINCIPGTKENILPGNCDYSCIGPCEPVISLCYYHRNPNLPFYCQNFNSYTYAKAAVKCFGGAGSYRSYGCCVYC